jgi:hypothetical protein
MQSTIAKTLTFPGSSLKAKDPKEESLTDLPHLVSNNPLERVVSSLNTSSYLESDGQFRKNHKISFHKGEA